MAGLVSLIIFIKNNEDSSNPRSGEGVSVSVLYSQTNEVKEFTNQTEAGEFLGVTRQEIYNAIKRGTSINGIYLISKIKQ